MNNRLIFGLLILGTHFVLEIEGKPFFSSDEKKREAESNEDSNEMEIELPSSKLAQLAELLHKFETTKLGILSIADVNNDEKLSYQELHDLAKTPNSKEAPQTSAEIKSVFAEADANGDGFIDPNEVKIMDEKQKS